LGVRIPARTLQQRPDAGAAAAVGPRRRVSCAASSNGTLPWQAAMDEVKKRKDLKSIMIIGAGPIVIGQVGVF
jgi:hypothetical protein